MKQNSKKLFPSTVIIAVVSLITVLTLTLAMFISDISVERMFEVSNFKVTGAVRFDGTSATPNSDGTYTVDFRDSSATNYIGKLEIGANYSGYGVAFLRIKVFEEWSKPIDGVKNVLPYTTDLPYIYVNEYSGSGNQKKWFNNRSEDGWFYYAAPIYSAESNESTEVFLPLIDGFTVDDIDIGAISTDTVLNIVLETEAVQVNRYPQFWGMSSLPWTNAVSATAQGVSNTP